MCEWLRIIKNLIVLSEIIQQLKQKLNIKDIFFLLKLKTNSSTKMHPHE